MLWKTLLEGLIDTPVCFCATATTGIKPATDKLLAFATLESGVQRLLIRRLDHDSVLQSLEYTDITEEQVLSEGLDEEDFIDAVQEALKGKTLFTYRPSFHMGFLENTLNELPPRMYDLPLLLRAAESRMVLGTKDSDRLAELEDRLYDMVGKPPGFKKMCSLRGLDFEIGELPIIQSVHHLQSLWGLLLELPISVQPLLVL